MKTVQWIIVVALVGLISRGCLVTRPPAPSTYWDHHEYVQWGAQMQGDGLLSVYSTAPPQLRMWSHAHQKALPTQRDDQTPCNYPPLGVYLVYLEALVLKSFSPELISNTPAARMIYAVLPVLGDVLAAIGCFAIVRRFANRTVSAWAGAACFLLPPLILDSAWWTQTDAWVLAPAVWVVWAMLARRWWLAGILWGAALGLKTQAALLVPLWFCAVMIHTERRRIIGAAALAAVVLLLIALPFTLDSGFEWFERSYSFNIMEAYKQTTLKAFNIWYFDLLISENDDASRTLFGLQKDLVGKVLLFAGLSMAVAASVRGRRSAAERLLRFAAASLLLAILLPTRVHERYIVLALPLLVCVAALDRRLRVPAVLFVVAASFQITSLQWMSAGAQHWGYIQADIHRQYGALGEQLPPEDFARLRPPEEQIAHDRPTYLAHRWKTGDPYREWALTMLAVASGMVCVGRLLRAPPANRSEGRLQSTARRCRPSENQSSREQGPPADAEFPPQTPPTRPGHPR